MCRPIITFRTQIWAVVANTSINKIQKMQNKFLHIILNKPYNIPIKLNSKHTNYQRIHTELTHQGVQL